MRQPEDPECTPLELFAGLWPCALCGQPRFSHFDGRAGSITYEMPGLRCASDGPRLYRPAPIRAVFPPVPQGWRAD